MCIKILWIINDPYIAVWDNEQKNDDDQIQTKNSKMTNYQKLCLLTLMNNVHIV